MSGRRFLMVLVGGVLLFCVGISGAAAGGAAVYLAVRDQAQPVAAASQAGEASPAGPQVINVDINTAVEKAVAQVGPAVVTVVNDLATGGQASGSGVIISADGYVITNNHVVEGNRDLHVIYQDGTTVAASLVGADSYVDIAVMKVDGPVPAHAGFGNSDALNPGETVIAIGSPLGDFRNSVTVGVVSATGRSIESNEANFQMQGLIQTDAAINHGNSGGPLVNLAGQVVGINTLVVRGNGFTSDPAEGLGFAVAANIAQATAQQLIDHGYVSRPYLGLTWQAVTPADAQAYGLPVDWGIYITDVTSGSPADKAGIRRGDILTRIGDVALDNDHPFINSLWDHAVGDTVLVTLVRGSDTLTVNVTLAERPRS
jgi:S1-C subfamily serine protease